MEKETLRVLASGHAAPGYTVGEVSLDEDGTFGVVEFRSDEFGAAPSITLYLWEEFGQEPAWSMSNSTGSKMEKEQIQQYRNQLDSTLRLINILNLALTAEQL